MAKDYKSLRYLMFMSYLLEDFLLFANNCREYVVLFVVNFKINE